MSILKPTQTQNLRDQSLFENRLLHPCFQQPKQRGVHLWRYMNLAKYVSLLCSKGLYLPRLDKFSDPFEGTLPKLWVELMAKWLPEKDQGTFDELRPVYKKTRHCVFVSCWHISNFESEAMWRLYGSVDGGIAVQTTYEELAESIRDERDGYIGMIKYIDYNNALFPDNNALHPTMHKRLAFRHEQEVRIIRWDPKYFHAAESSPNAMTLSWDARKYAHRVYIDPLAPQYFFDAVKSVTEALAPELASKLQWSRMKDSPTL